MAKQKPATKKELSKNMYTQKKLNATRVEQRAGRVDPNVINTSKGKAMLRQYRSDRAITGAGGDVSAYKFKPREILSKAGKVADDVGSFALGRASAVYMAGQMGWEIGKAIDAKYNLSSKIADKMLGDDGNPNSKYNINKKRK